MDKWNQIRGEVVSLSKNLLKQVEWALKEYFDGCVEEMEKFFKYVQGADCLSGRSKSGFKASLYWLLKACNLERALSYWGQRCRGKRQPPDVIVPLVPPSNKLQQAIRAVIGDPAYISFFQGREIVNGRYVIKNKFEADYFDRNFNDKLDAIYRRLDANHSCDAAMNMF